MLINLRFLVTSELKSCSAFNVCKHYSVCKSIYRRDVPISSFRFKRSLSRKNYCPDSYFNCNTQSRRASRLAYHEFGSPSEVVKYETFEDPCIEDPSQEAKPLKQLKVINNQIFVFRGNRIIQYRPAPPCMSYMETLKKMP